jgi:hypothetical protein
MTEFTEFEQQVADALPGHRVGSPGEGCFGSDCVCGRDEEIVRRVAAAVSAVQNETLRQFGINPLRLTPIAGAMITGAALAALRGP